MFFIIFRETLETAIIISVLLAFLKRNLGSDGDLFMYKKLRRQVSLAVPATGLDIHCTKTQSSLTLS